MDRGERLGDHGEIAVADPLAQLPGVPQPLQQCAVELVRLDPGEEHVLCRYEGPRQPDGDRRGVGQDHVPHEGTERLPDIALALDRLADQLGVAGQPVGAELAEQVLLAGIPPVQGADPDSCPLGDLGDRRPGVGYEHLAGRLENELVVSEGLGLAAAERSVGHGRHPTRNRVLCSNTEPAGSPEKVPGRPCFQS
ncbi:hypothetical protein GCM10029992_55910 [Glycomyces albus]